MLNGSGLITGKMPSKNSKRLFLKHQYSITLVRVTKQGDKTMDGSEDGFGFLLMQHCQPVTYRSGALSVAERKYSQAEK